MAFVKDFFKAIDVFFDKLQNNCPFVKNREDEIVIEKDIIYNVDSPNTCRLDTYSLKLDESKKRPVLFYIHGGGFVAGGKQYRRGICSWFALNGLFVVNVDYGLSPDFKFPEPIKHLCCAANWISENAERLKLDTEKIIISGDSAGGYYAAMLCAISTNKILQKSFDCNLQTRFGAAVLNCGLYDIQETLKSKIILDMDKKILQNFTGITANEFDNYEYKDFCSPINYINDKFPPSFLLYSKKDLFCKGQAEKFICALYDNGIYTESYRADKFMTNHCFSFLWKEKNAAKANEKTLLFIKKFTDGTLISPKSRYLPTVIYGKEKRSSFCVFAGTD